MCAVVRKPKGSRLEQLHSLSFESSYGCNTPFEQPLPQKTNNENGRCEKAIRHPVRQLIKRERQIQAPLMLFIAAVARSKIQNGENEERTGPWGTGVERNNRKQSHGRISLNAP